MNNIAEELDMAENIIHSPKMSKRISESSAIKLLPKLIEAFSWGHKQRITEIGGSVAEAIEAHHPAVAKKIRDIFGHDLKPVKSAAKAQEIVSFEEPSHGFDSIVLSANVESECRAIVQEHNRREDLAAYGLSPRHRILLHGSPGNGKTMLAEAFAYEMEIPYLRVKYSGLIDSYLGSTAKNLEAIFEYAHTAPCLLFLDEFDGVGMDRNDNRDVGEMRRITNQLLISLERLPSTCVFVGATNAPNLIDTALKRRFDFIIEVPTPTADLKLRCARTELSPSITPGHNVIHLAGKIAEMPLPNLYEVVELCRRIRRDLVLNRGEGIDTLLSLGQ